MTPAPRTFERYPAWMVAVSVLHSLAVYALGVYLVLELGAIALLAYALLIGYVELRVLRSSCVDCGYYGKRCGLGRGILAARLFERGDPGRFGRKPFRWYHVVPDFLVALVPLAVGLALSFARFAWPRLAALVVLGLLWFVGTALVRGRLACAHCRQRAVCPAAKLFEVEPASARG